MEVIRESLFLQTVASEKNNQRVMVMLSLFGNVVLCLLVVIPWTANEFR